MPKISVIIPCYNQGHYLKETVSSVRNQTEQDWECIIVDDGSTDNTKEIAATLVSEDNRIKYLSKKNGGLSSARNTGLQISKGDYIQFLDSDDYIAPNKFQKQLSLMEANPRITISVTRYHLCKDTIDNVYDTTFSLHKYDFSLNALLYKWGKTFTFPPVCYLVRHDFLTANNIYFNENLRAYEDWLFLLKLKMLGAEFHSVEDFLALYRQHSNQMTQDAHHMLSTLIPALIEASRTIPENEVNTFAKRMGEYVYQRYYNVVKFDLAKGKSIDYRIGHMLITPFRYLKKILAK